MEAHELGTTLNSLLKKLFWQENEMEVKNYFNVKSHVSLYKQADVFVIFTFFNGLLKQNQT